MIDDARYQHLKTYTEQSDREIDLGSLALDMVVLDHEGISLDRYNQHLKKLSNKVANRHKELIDIGSDDDVYARLAALKYVLSDTYDYRLDDFDVEALESADIMRVIDRAKGCSSALCVLYMIAARAQNWVIEGLNFPNMFLCRLEKNGQRIIFSPASNGQCKILEAHDLRAILKDVLGDGAELSNTYFDGLGARGSVINLYNHIKLRRIKMGDYRAALDMVLRMRVIAPNEYRLLLDSGVLYAKTHEIEQAVECLNEYVMLAQTPEERLQAQLLLDDLLL